MKIVCDCRCSSTFFVVYVLRLFYIVLLFSPKPIWSWPSAPDPSLETYMSDSWAMLSGRIQSQSSCVSIPRNFTLCHGIDYDQMRLPNLLEHETLDEAVQQASPWNSLLRLNCHADTQVHLRYTSSSVTSSFGLVRLTTGANDDVTQGF